MKKILAIVIFFGFFSVTLGLGVDSVFVNKYREGEKAIRILNFNKALKIYRGLEKKANAYGFAAEVKFRIAQCYYNLKKYNDALKYLEMIERDIQADASYAYMKPYVNFALALTFYQKGDKEKANALLQDPSTEPLGGVGVADYLIRNDYASAYDHLKDKSYPIAKLFLARAVLSLENNEEYLSDVNYILDSLTEHVRGMDEVVNFTLGEIRFRAEGDYAAAKSKFESFVERYSTSSLASYARYYLACCEYNEEEYRKAIDIFTERDNGLIDRNMNPTLAASSYYMLGQAYYELGLKDSAVWAYNLAREMNNPMVDFYSTYKLYNLYKELGKISEANSEAVRLSNIDFGSQAQVYKDLGSYIRALTFYEMAQNGQATAYKRSWDILDTLVRNIPTKTNIMYEASYSLYLLLSNRLGLYGGLGVAASYIRSHKDTVPVQYGGEWRSYIIYNLGDNYYFMPDKKAKIKARKYYQQVVSDFPDSYVAPYADISLIWLDMEEAATKDAFDNASGEFKRIFTNTGQVEAKLLAMYGMALSNFYMKRYLAAAGLFLTPEEYEQKMRITPNRARVGKVEGVSYNELADSLVDENLYHKGYCYERVADYYQANGNISTADIYYDSSVVMYKRILDQYAEKQDGPRSSENLLKLYLRRNRENDALAVLDKLKALTGDKKLKRIYNDSYQRALALMYSFYIRNGDKEEAEKYARLMTDRKFLIQIWVDEVKDDTTVADIPHINEVLQKIMTENARSKYIPTILYRMAILEVQDKQFDKAREHFNTVRNWRPTSAVKDILPYVEFQLGLVSYQLNRFDETINLFEKYIKRYRNDENAKKNFGPATFYIGLSYYKKADTQASLKRREYAQKAKKILSTIKDKYPDYYETNKANIEKVIKAADLKMR